MASIETFQGRIRKESAPFFITRRKSLSLTDGSSRTAQLLPVRQQLSGIHDAVRIQRVTDFHHEL